MILALGVRNSLAPCVVGSPRLCRSLSELPTKTTQKGNAHKSANSQTHTYPDRTQHGTTHPDHAHVKHHKPHPSQTQTTPTQHTTHHNPPPPNTQTQKPNQKHKTGTRGNRGDEKERKEERRREKEEEKGEGEKHKTGTRGNRTPDLLHSPRGVRRSRTLPRDPQRIFCERAVGAFPGKPIDDQFAGPVLTSECSGT